MSDHKKRPPILHEPEQAIDNYLAALLSEVEEYSPEQELAEEKKSEPPMAEVVHFPNKVILPPTLPIVESPQPTVEVPTEQATEQQPTETVKVDEQTADDTESSDEVLVPEWAVHPFQSLLFKVRGMTLAVPLSELNSIAEWEGEVTPIPGQPDWHLGIYLHRDEQVIVVDTAQLVMPDRLSKVDGKRPHGSHILIIGGGQWGLACDSLQRPVTLTKEDIRWSRDNNLRPWMAGTIIEKLCILLNVDALLEGIRHK
ncbi:MAG: chemotaxis protein CheW [Chromatiales bacterium]|nr:chemotaxis protein CheW [Chromatiales bacterium]